MLGVLYDAGIGVLQDTEKALKFYQKAALKKHQGAMLNMYNYYNDDGADETAEYWLQKLAEHGLSEAQKKYIDLLRVQEKYEEYFIWCEKLAGQGDVCAQYKLAECLSKGIGCALNELKAINLYRQIVGRWNKEAQLIIAENMYNENNLLKRVSVTEIYEISINEQANYTINKLINGAGGNTSCKKEAYFWYKKLAEQGYIAAEKRLAECLYDGIVCEKNLEEALKWCQKAYKQGLKSVAPVIEKIKAELQVAEYREKAEKGDVQAQYLLAQCLEKATGCQKNIDDAFMWYEKAAEGGLAEAQNIWGEYLYKKAMCAEAVNFYRKAAQQGHKYAARNLAECLEKGAGCQKNLQEALCWYKKAYAQGVKVKQHIEVIEKALEKQALFNKYTEDAKKGVVSAQYALAECLYNGDGCAVNRVQALAWYEKIVGNWSAEDQYILANNFYYINAKYALKRVVDVYRKAINKDKNYTINADMEFACTQERDWKGRSVGEYWYKTAAEGGFAEAQNKYAEILQKRKEDEEAFKWYKTAAKQGLARAQGNLAECYINGVGVTADLELAKEWCKKASKHNDAKAQCYMGKIFSLTGGERYSWYRKAAEQGYAKAQNAVARYLAEGWGGVTKNQIEAVEWYRKAAEQGYPIAQYNLAVCLENGIGCAIDEEKALIWYKKAAEQGDEDAKIAIERLSPKDTNSNLKELIEVAKTGNQYAQYIIAEKLYYGIDCIVNKDEALKWYRLAASNGHGDARKKLEYLSVNASQEVQNESSNDKITNLRKAAERGDVVTQNDLGNCLYYGRGCDKNRYEAVEWYRRAAEQGYDKAQNNLAQCLENGEGCERDLQGALVWYKRAAEQGNRSAESGIERIENPFNRSHESSASTQVAAQSSGCLLPILVTLTVIVLFVIL